MREKWIKARATIVESPDSPEGATGPTFHAMSGEHHYVIDIPAPDGQFHRTTVTMFGRFVHEVGAPLFVELSTKTGEVKVDFHAMSQLAQSQLASHRLAEGELPGRPARTAPGGRPGPAGSPAGSGTSFSAFGTTGGSGTAEQRLAQLRQLLDKGILTESEYAAKRQGIISEL